MCVLCPAGLVKCVHGMLTDVSVVRSYPALAADYTLGIPHYLSLISHYTKSVKSGINSGKFRRE